MFGLLVTRSDSVMKSHSGFLVVRCSKEDDSSSASFGLGLTRARWIRLAIFACAVLPVCASSVTAQWRTPTPRDTLFVPANSQNVTQSKLFPSSAVLMNLYVTGTFGAFPGQFSSGFDGRYTSNVPNWSAPFPLPNPPTFNGKNYQIYLAINTNGFVEDSIRVFEPTYQPSHNYTARYRGSGTFFKFRIKDRLNERPDGYYYSQASGGIGIRMAQFTAGVAVKLTNLNFGNVNVGGSSAMLDSIASYGIDPLTIDNVWIDGPNAADFTFISERGTRFTLANEASNYFRVTYSPSGPYPSQATLHIHSTNADAPDTIRNITLDGIGSAPNEQFNTLALDFGRVRVTYSSNQLVNIFNAGTANLYIDSIWQNGGAPAGVFVPSFGQPVVVGPQTLFSHAITFYPQSQKLYHAVMYFKARGGRVDSIMLNGEGAQPDFVIDMPTLNFGTVRTFDQVTLTDTVRNLGSWTANITHVTISGPGKSAYSATPTDSAFLLNAGGTLGYAIKFQPKNGTDANLTAQLDFYFDNAAASQHIILNGFEQRPRLIYDTNLVDFGRVKLMNTATRSVGVSNTSGGAESFASNVAVPNDPFPVFRVAHPQPNTFAINKDSLNLVFQPNIHGPLGAWLHLDATNQHDSIYLFGFGAQALPVFDPPIINFNVVPSGTQNYFSTRVSDTGDYPLNICDLHISGPDSTYFTIANPPQLPFSVADSGLATKQLGVYFSTSAHTGRMYYARLELRYCDGTVDTIPLYAQEAAQFVQYSVGSNRTVDFGNVHVGATGTQSVAFFNGANIALNVGNIWLTPPNSPFAFADTTATVPSNGLKKVPVTFTPPARGKFSAWHHANKGDIKEDSVILTGIGVAAVPVLSTKLVDLGTTVMHTTSPAKVLTLTNAGDWPVGATLTKIGDKYHEFSILMPQGGNVDSVAQDSAHISEARSYSITFKPQIPKLPDHEADILFSFDDGTTQMVHLVAKDESDFLVIDSSNIDFGKVRIGKPAATRWVHLINTTPHDLSVSGLQLPAQPFSASPGLPISVVTEGTDSLLVSFAPTAIGPVQSILAGKGIAFQYGDTVLLSGIGAAPVAALSTDTLDFGTLPTGHPANRGVTLSNDGNWPLYSHWTISGPNAADFAPMIPGDTAIDFNTATNYTVGYTATTPLQLVPRTATITFVDTEDNSSFTLTLIARDRPPLTADISVRSCVGRPGDKIFTFLTLDTPIPDTLGVQHLSGSVTYDPANVSLIPPVLPGALMPTGRWATKITNLKPGSFDYDLSSTTDTLTGPGTLLRLNFQVHSDANVGAQSPLAITPAFPSTHDVVAQATGGEIVIEGACGAIPVSNGEATASFIAQNTPNPFGSYAPVTNLPFDVGDDGTVVTIRIVNAAGLEVLRPLDHVPFARGTYKLPVSAKDLGSGVYFYEFEASGKEPQVKRMVVE